LKKKIQTGLTTQIEYPSHPYSSLRERKADIRPLLEFYVNLFSTNFNKPKITISEEVIETLEDYEFPGNVRELKNMAERAVILCQSNQLNPTIFLLTN